MPRHGRAPPGHPAPVHSRGLRRPPALRGEGFRARRFSPGLLSPGHPTPTPGTRWAPVRGRPSLEGRRRPVLWGAALFISQAREAPVFNSKPGPPSSLPAVDQWRAPGGGLFNQRCGRRSSVSTSVCTFGSVCLLSVRASWSLRSKEIAFPRAKRFLHSQQAGQSLRYFKRFEIPKRWLTENGQTGVLVGDVILMLINKHASAFPPPPPPLPFFFK